MNITEVEYAPLEAFQSLAHLRNPVFLDSSRYHPSLGRYSFLTADPILTIQTQNGSTQISSQNNNLKLDGDPWEILDALLSRFRTPDLPHLPFPNGAAFGYLGYDMGRWLEKTPPFHSHLISTPEMWFGFFDVLLTFDHLEKRGWIISCGIDKNGFHSQTQADFRRDQFLDELQSSISPFPLLNPLTGNIIQLVSQNEHEKAVRKALHYIRQGDVYQVNLAHPFLGTIHGPPVPLYLELRKKNPAPFSAYLDFGSGQILSSSPERFLQMKHRWVQTRPIKGTCARTGSPEIDQKNSQKLLRSEKNRAELLMITDLLRNDLGKISEFGSVHVPEMVCLEEYQAVYHLVSTIEAKLKPSILHLDALAACFPGGSITGAPKIRSMEIIHELELYQRGPYTGSLGYIGFNGVSDTNILIRTLVHQNGRACFHVGGGIVADSNPTLEYEETLHKAKAILGLWDAQNKSDRNISQA